MCQTCGMCSTQIILFYSCGNSTMYACYTYITDETMLHWSLVTFPVLENKW